jgi:hypothetical protein
MTANARRVKLRRASDTAVNREGGILVIQEPGTLWMKFPPTFPDGLSKFNSRPHLKADI